jgi:outer membrane protein OmpA-like peptidoglycan-associated protein/uncharacterized protein YidB (DUF937 family)
MSPFDNIIEDIAGRFGLGTKAGPLLRELLLLVTGSGGISALIDKFKSAGLSREVDGWLGNAGNTAAAPTSWQVEQALGSKTVDTIAQKVGLTGSAASAAIGYLMPKVIGQLTPGGVIGSGIPSSVSDFLRTSALGGTFRPETMPYGAPPARASANPGRWIAPALALLALAGLGWYFLSRETPSTVATTSTPASVVAPDRESSLVSDATNKATAALAGLGTGFRTTDLLGILNKSIINFPTGSAEIPPMSLALLQQAAKPFKQLPASTVIEIGGYTDNTGDTAANLALSQHRADAVRTVLIASGVSPTILMAKGYGSTKPVASNDTPEGRFQNRRIEYQVSDGNRTTEGSAH